MFALDDRVMSPVPRNHNRLLFSHCTVRQSQHGHLFFVWCPAKLYLPSAFFADGTTRQRPCVNAGIRSAHALAAGGPIERADAPDSKMIPKEAGNENGGICPFIEIGYGSSKTK